MRACCARGQLAGPRKSAGRRRRDPSARDLRAAGGARARGDAALQRLAGRAAARDARWHRRASRRHALHLSSSSRVATIERVLARRSADVLVEDINKVPLCTPRWGAKPHASRSCRTSSATTAFQELAAPLAAAVWLPERPLGRVYRDVPFEAISESTADDLAARGIRATRIAVIYPGIDTRRLHAGRRRNGRAVPLFAYLGRLKRYKGVRSHHPRLRADAASRRHSSRSPGAGDHRPALEALAASLDLGDRVQFLGLITEAEKAGAAPARVGARVHVAEGRVGDHESRGGRMRHAGRRIELAGASANRCVDGETGFLVPHGDRARAGRGAARASRAIPRSSHRSAQRRARFASRLHVGSAPRSRPRRISSASSQRGPRDVEHRDEKAFTVGRVLELHDASRCSSSCSATTRGLSREILSSRRLEPGARARGLRRALSRARVLRCSARRR